MPTLDYYVCAIFLLCQVLCFVWYSAALVIAWFWLSAVRSGCRLTTTSVKWSSCQVPPPSATWCLKIHARFECLTSPTPVYGAYSFIKFVIYALTSLQRKLIDIYDVLVVCSIMLICNCIIGQLRLALNDLFAVSAFTASCQQLSKWSLIVWNHWQGQKHVPLQPTMGARKGGGTGGTLALPPTGIWKRWRHMQHSNVIP